MKKTTVPGFARYEWDGKTLTNAKSGKALAFKSGKYQVQSDKNKNVGLTKEKLNELCAAPKAKPAKAAKATGEKRVTIKSQVLELAGSGMLAPAIFESLKKSGVKTNLNSVRWYISQEKNAA